MTNTRLTKKPRFLSTPSARRATGKYKPTELGEQISIHALREEGDLTRHYICTMEDETGQHALREEGDLTRRSGWS